MKKEKQKKEMLEEEKKVKIEKTDINNQECVYHKYLWYLILFSVIGLFVEIILCFIIGKMSNKEFGLILGPFCIIYGLGVATAVFLLDRFKQKRIKLFILGAILGTIIEYTTSFILEAILGARLWNCEGIKFSANGRTCIQHAILWGILSVIVISFLKKYIDILINKMRGRKSLIVDIIFTMVLVVIIILTIWGAITYSVRAKEILNGKNYTSNNNIIEKFQNTVFSDEIMEKIFSNMEIMDNEGRWILVKNING